MNSNPEQHFERFRLPAPSPELRARVLAAARQEWNQPAPVSAWWTLRRPLLAVAAALVLAFAAGQANRRLAAPLAMVSVPAPRETDARALESIGIPADVARLASTAAPNPAAIAAARQDQRMQILEMEEIYVPQTPAPGGQTRWHRQNSPFATSCG